MQASGEREEFADTIKESWYNKKIPDMIIDKKTHLITKPNRPELFLCPAAQVSQLAPVQVLVLK